MSCTLYDTLTFTFMPYLACIIHNLTFITCTTNSRGAKKREGALEFKNFRPGGPQNIRGP